MVTSYGYATIAGWRREPVVSEPTWPAAAATPVRAVLPILSIQSSDGVSTVSTPTVLDQYGASSQEVIAIAPHETWTCQLRYEGFEQLWACALGFMSAGGASGIGGGAVRHVYEIDSRLGSAEPWTGTSGPRRVRRGTAAVYRQVSVWEHISTMVNKLTVAATIAGARFTVELVGARLQRSGTVNTAEHMQALPVVSAPNVLLRHGAVKLGIGSLLEQDCSAWTLTLDNHLTSSTGPKTGLGPEEYERSAPPTVTLALTIARYQTDAWLAALAASTLLSASIQLTGGAIGGSGIPYQLGLYVPALALTSVDPPVSGPGLPTMQVNGTGLTPIAQPAGFPAVDHLSSLQVVVVSGESRHPLLGE